MMSKGEFVNVTSIGNTGDVKVRQYHNREQKFYEDGKVVEFDFKMKNNRHNQLSEDQEKQLIADYTTKHGEPTEDRRVEIIAEYNDYMAKNNKPLSDEQLKEKNRQYAEKMGGQGNTSNTMPTTSTKKDSKPKTIKIQLGFGCNFSCSYCKQAIHASKADASNMTDVNDFIAKFDDWCDLGHDEYVMIQLWGGEPLLYWDKVVTLNEFFEKRFEKFMIGFVSNGSLLDETKANYLIDHDISITISHDGPTNLDNRTEDPIAEGSESLKWIKYILENHKKGISFNSVISKQNLDPLVTINYIKDIVGQKANVGFEGVVTVESMGQFDDDTLFTDGDYTILRDNIKNGIRNGELLSVTPFSMKIKSLFQTWSSSEAYLEDTGLQKCGMDDPNTIAVDLKGDVLACHSTPDVVGSVYDIENVDLKNSTFKHWSEKEECSSCPLLAMCRGACMLLEEGDPWYYTCNNEFQFNMAIFEAAFELFFREKILSIDGDIKRYEKGVSAPVVIPTVT